MVMHFVPMCGCYCCRGFVFSFFLVTVVSFLVITVIIGTLSDLQCIHSPTTQESGHLCLFYTNPSLKIVLSSWELLLSWS